MRGDVSRAALSIATPLAAAVARAEKVEVPEAGRETTPVLVEAVMRAA